MLYHMKESDRLNFLSLPKPSDSELPRALRDQLDSTLRTWIKDKYANAYVCFMLRSIKPSTEGDWREKLSDEEKEKIWYWWNGAVSCLLFAFLCCGRLLANSCGEVVSCYLSIARRYFKTRECLG